MLDCLEVMQLLACKEHAHTYSLSGEGGSNVSNARTEAQPGPWKSEFNDLVRGLSGGFLFGIPLLYTMEVWWLGTHSHPWRLLLLLLLSFVINWMLGHFAGFRQGMTPINAVLDALEALAIGIVASAVTLVVLGELRPGVPFDTVIGMIALESVPFSLGVSIANSFLSGSKDGPQDRADGDKQGGEQENEDQPETKHTELNGTIRDAGATVAGALFVAFSVAPTEEIPMLAGNLGSLGLITLVFFSLLVSYAITFEAGFADQEARMGHEGIFQRPLSETVFSYLVALVVAGVLLWIFKQLEFGDPGHVWLERMIVLGLPAAIGGSAGRLTVSG